MLPSTRARRETVGSAIPGAGGCPGIIPIVGRRVATGFTVLGAVFIAALIAGFATTMAASGEEAAKEVGTAAGQPTRSSDGLSNPDGSTTAEASSEAWPTGYPYDPDPDWPPVHLQPPPPSRSSTIDPTAIPYRIVDDIFLIDVMFASGYDIWGSDYGNETSIAGIA